MCGLVPESDTPKEEHYGLLSNGIYVALLVPLLLLAFVPVLPVGTPSSVALLALPALSPPTSPLHPLQLPSMLY